MPIATKTFSRLHAAAALCLMAVLAGCKAPTKQQAPKSSANITPQSRPAPVPVDATTPILTADPCANRLHDICGALLLYYAVYHQLPGQLNELSRVPGFEHVNDFTCPISKKPYIYNPTGMLDIERNTRIIIYDPAPSHRGTRWAISVVEPRGNEALVTKVVGLPENWFVLHPPK
jgi:hypothetical protein